MAISELPREVQNKILNRFLSIDNNIKVVTNDNLCTILYENKVITELPVDNNWNDDEIERQVKNIYRQAQNSWYMDEGNLKGKAYLKRYEDTNETERNRIISETIEKINNDFKKHNIKAHLEKVSFVIHLMIEENPPFVGNIGFHERYLINDNYNELLRIVNYLITSHNEESNVNNCPTIPLGNI